MAISFAQILQMTPDSGDGEPTDSNDFVTAANSLTFSGLAAGSGDMAIWLMDSAIPPPGVEIGSVSISPTNGLWSFTLPVSLQNGNYTLQLRDGTGVGGAVLATQSFAVDTQDVTVTVNPIEGGTNVLTNPEALAAGLPVSGTATGSDFQNFVGGEGVTVQVRDALTNQVMASQTGTVDSNGHWSVNFSTSQAETLKANGFDGYYITASVTDEAGNVGTSSPEQFTSTICFMPGTRIRTPAGEANVETLKRGDLVLTVDGQAAPIAWIGRQTVSRIFADPVRVWPIRIKAGALGEHLPARDLLLSPDHAILLDGILVQAAALVNGSSIVRESDIPATFTYYHIELADHSLILAENVPAETFIDNVDRMAFDNWDEHQALYPDGRTIEEMPYPRAQSLRQVPQALRERLAQRGAARVGQRAGASAA
jgi:hypothetical protein